VPGAYKCGTSLGRPSSRWQDTIEAYPKEMGGGLGGGGLDSCGIGYERVKVCFEYGNAPGGLQKMRGISWLVEKLWPFKMDSAPISSTVTSLQGNAGEHPLGWRRCWGLVSERLTYLRCERGETVHHLTKTIPGIESHLCWHVIVGSQRYR
jgi:hypothetical protein